jgi:aromatic ring-cleaving dioxygenase
MSHSAADFAPDQHQPDLERYLLESAIVNQEQLSLAKKLQVKQEGPLLMILLQLSFIDLQQFSNLVDWLVHLKVNGY